MQIQTKPSHEEIEQYSDQYLKFLNTRNSSTLSPLQQKELENCQFLIESLNTLSLQNTQKSFEYLSKAKKLSKSLLNNVKTQDHSQELFYDLTALRTLTLINLAHYFKSCKKLIAAHSHLSKALHLERSSKQNLYKQATLLMTLTAVLSQMGNHTKSLDHALAAINLLETSKNSKQVTEILSTAYYNCGVEFEYLGKVPEAKLKYEQAYEISRQTYGEKNPRTENFLNQLIEFNFSHSCKKSTRKSLTIDKSLLPTKPIGKIPIDVLLTVYKKFCGMRFKVFFINKPVSKVVKVLAFPQNKQPLYRLFLRYEEIPFRCWETSSKVFKELSLEETRRLMQNLSELLRIEKGALLISQPNRPYSSVSGLKTKSITPTNLFKS